VPHLRKIRGVPKKSTNPVPNSVKLTEPLRARIAKAMQVEGSEVFAEWARTAFTEKCRRIEGQLLRDNPEEYQRIYGKP
jgi:hypothetical protein